MEYGELRLKLMEIMTERGISKNRICKDLDILRPNFNRYYRNEFQRIDSLFLCKLCSYLKVGVGDLVEYIPPERKTANTPASTEDAE